MRYLKATPAAVAALSEADPVLGEWMELVGPLQRPLHSNLFTALVHGIIGQQISTQAAETVCQRLEAALSPVTPEALAEAGAEVLRACGLSARKIAYLQELATQVVQGEIDLTALSEASNKDVVETLCALRGIGPWTAEMFLLFGLGRTDVFSVGDLGLRRGLCRLYGMDAVTPALLEGSQRRFAPWQSVASLYLWLLAAEPDAAISRQEAQTTMETPIGLLTLRASGKGLRAIDFADENVASSRHPRHPVLRLAVHELDAYFAGRLKVFSVPLDEGGTPFQRLVWQHNRAIPYGQTYAYGELARAIGRPSAARAVAGALHRNPLSIITPCHRVIGADGALTGYGGGLWRKAALLELERGE